MPGNDPFRIENIVNGTSYNISVSLRNDFGESGQTTALYGEGKIVSTKFFGNSSHYAPHSSRYSPHYAVHCSRYAPLISKLN